MNPSLASSPLQDFCSATAPRLSKQVWKVAGELVNTSIADEARSLTDEQLIALSRESLNAAAQSSALNELFQRYSARVALWCFRVTGDRNSAADLAQEVMLRAFQNLDAFRGDAKFSTWLYSVARNHCLNHLQTRGTRREESLEPEMMDIASAYSERFEHEIDRARSTKSLQMLLTNTLEDTERAVMTLHYGEEMRLDAITRLLGLTNPSGAKAYVVSARRKLAAAVARMKSQHGKG